MENSQRGGELAQEGGEKGDGEFGQGFLENGEME